MTKVTTVITRQLKLHQERITELKINESDIERQWQREKEREREVRKKYVLIKE